MCYYVLFVKFTSNFWVKSFSTPIFFSVFSNFSFSSFLIIKCHNNTSSPFYIALCHYQEFFPISFFLYLTESLCSNLMKCMFLWRPLRDFINITDDYCSDLTWEHDSSSLKPQIPLRVKWQSSFGGRVHLWVLLLLMLWLDGNTSPLRLQLLSNTHTHTHTHTHTCNNNSFIIFFFFFFFFNCTGFDTNKHIFRPGQVH